MGFVQQERHCRAGSYDYDPAHEVTRVYLDQLLVDFNPFLFQNEVEGLIRLSSRTTANKGVRLWTRYSETLELAFEVC